MKTQTKQKLRTTYVSLTFYEAIVKSNEWSRYSIPSRYRELPFNLEQAIIDYEKMIECGGLYFTGDVGVGKTYRLYNLWILCTILKIKYSFVRTLFEFFSDLKEDMDTINHKLFKYKNNWDVVFFDDFGVESGTPFEMQCLYDVINALWRDKRSIVITSNLKPAEWLEKNDLTDTAIRIMDRLRDMTHLVEMRGKSLRMKK